MVCYRENHEPGWLDRESEDLSREDREGRVKTGPEDKAIVVCAYPQGAYGLIL